MTRFTKAAVWTVHAIVYSIVLFWGAAILFGLLGAAVFLWRLT